MLTAIVILILLAIAGSIIWYLYRAKKRGETCIGCPYAKQCGKGSKGSKGSKCSGGCTGCTGCSGGAHKVANGCNTANTSNNLQ